MPSSPCIACTSTPNRSRIRARHASAHGACTCAPYGECTTTRQSPSSSRNRSTTMVRSSGTWPVASRCSSQVGEQVVGGPLVQTGGADALAGRRGLERDQLADERADGAAQLGRPAQRVAVPERQLAGLAGRRRDQHPVVGDVLDPPGRRAEGEHVADPRLVDHLLVELADPPARTPRRVARNTP